ncbi:MAG: hypothetical protein ACXAB4_07390, partial [Candidatus Hodarchaeales archaeon]
THVLSSGMESVLFANVISPYFVAARRVSSLVNRPLTEQRTREASLGVFWNFPDNGDRVVFTTGLRLIN